MGVNKVIYGDVTIIDTSEMTVTPDKMFAGETTLGSDGEIKTGTFTIDSEIEQQNSLISQIQTALQGKAAGGESAAPVIEALTVTENGTYTAPEGVDGYSPVIVNMASNDADLEQYVADLFADNISTFINSVITKLSTYAFYGRKNLVRVSLPNLTTISSYAFAYCSALRIIDLPNVLSTSSFSLRNCTGLEAIDFPKLYSIGTGAFQGNTSLITVILRKTDAVVTLSGVNAFTSTPIASGTGYIYVPAALVDSYKAATNWSTYANQVRAIEAYPGITGG